MGTKKIAIQGIIGSYHQAAAEKFFRNQKISYDECLTFKDVTDSLEHDKADFGVMAIENTIAGTILPNYKLLGRGNQKIVGEVYIPISHCLLALPGTKIEELKEVESHPMAIMQCEQFFEAYPDIRLIESVDTARSARKVAQSGVSTTGAIAGEVASRMFGLDILASGIQTIKDNYTRFFVIGKEPLLRPDQADKATLNIIARHESGSLSRILMAFSLLGINLTKLQSMPIMERPWHYSFQIDITFPSLRIFESAIEVVEKQTEELKILGMYKSGDMFGL